VVRAICIVVGSICGFVMTALSASRVWELPIVEAVRLELTSVVGIVPGIIAGALAGGAVWTVAHPRSLARLGRVMLAANCAAWLLFLIATPRIELGGNGIDPVLQHRAELDAQEALSWPEGITLISHPPSLLAGRDLTWVTLPEKPLVLLAEPAVVFVEAHVVPSRYWQTGPTIDESYWIAPIAFGLSTAWWATVPWLWSSFRRWRKSFSRQPTDPPQPTSGATRASG
jgi:hypothetical protein